MDPARKLVHLYLSVTEEVLTRALDVVRVADTLLVASAQSKASSAVTPPRGSAWPEEETGDLAGASAALRARTEPEEQERATRTPATRTPATRTPAKKASTKKASTKKTPAKKTPTKKASTKKTTAKRAPASTSAKKTPAKKTSAKKTPAKNTSSTSTTAAKRGTSTA
ncbi:hypothetical protein GCM10022199_20890 [Marihabitans asiaticum]